MLVSWNQAIAAKHRTGFARKFRNYLEWRDDGAGKPSGGMAPDGSNNLCCWQLNESTWGSQRLSHYDRLHIFDGLR
jgi:hypothetical protein